MKIRADKMLLPPGSVRGMTREEFVAALRKDSARKAKRAKKGAKR